MNDKYEEEILALERQLAELDLSDSSGIRDSLRHELSQKIAASRRGEIEEKRDHWRWNMFRKPLPAMALGIILGAVILALAHPDTRAALVNIIKSIRVGKNTYIYQSGKVTDAEIDATFAEFDEALEKGERYHLDNVYGGFGGRVPEGAEPVIKQVSSLSIAARMVDYPLQVPTYFNEKIPPRYRFRKAEILPDGSSLLYFGIGSTETMLKQSPVGDGRSVGHMSVTMTINEDGTSEITGDEPNVEELEIAGKRVVWEIHDEGTRRNLGRWAEKYTDKVIGRFVWEDEGMSYLLDGRLLTKEEGRKIIESLRPMRAKK